MNPLGMITSWLPVLFGEPVVLPPIKNGSFNLVERMSVLSSYGVVPSVLCGITSVGVLKTRAALRAVSVTIFYEAIVWRTWKVPLLAATPFTIVG